MNAVAQLVKCRLCSIRLSHDNRHDDFGRQLCGDCRKHPASRSLGPVRSSPLPARNNGQATREFTVAEKSLIRKVHGYMATAQLLALLNERLQADLGDDVEFYTAEQLHAEIRDLPAASANAGSWTDLRKRLAKARREGVLDLVTPQIIDDFAIVFALSSAQKLRLKDAVLTAKENANG